MLTKNNYCQSDEHLRNFLTRTQNANSSSCCHRHCTGSPWCTLQSCFPFCSCQVSPPNHLTLGWWMSGFKFLESLCLEIALQCLLSELLWVVEVSQGFFLLFSLFLFRDGSRAWCMLNKCADLSYLSIPPSPPTLSKDAANYANWSWTCSVSRHSLSLPSSCLSLPRIWDYMTVPSGPSFSVCCLSWKVYKIFHSLFF